MEDKLAIRELLENWILWRDTAHTDGEIVEALHAHGRRWLDGAASPFRAGRPD